MEPVMVLKKVQVVIMATTNSEWHTLLLQTNKQRGSFWQNVTGHVKAGETFEEAAQRELLEETQLKSIQTIEPLPLTLQFDDKRTETYYQEECFLAFSPTLLNPKLDPNEHQNFKWVPVQEMNSHSYHYGSNFKAYEKAVDHLPSL